ncbi:Retinal guanylyl cyclase 2 [Taenia crassiceps]|uniref:guanylate cyclase n=1 Tax=Taenia crassiceps TaxID=6207 RepID=A0ABR4Q4K5_9CEST
MQKNASKSAGFSETHLSQVGPTTAAGRSLIVVTALPMGTRFEEVSMPYKEQINLSVARAVNAILMLNLLGVFNVGLIYIAIALVYRRILRKTKRFNSLKLVPVESDLAFEESVGHLTAKQRHDGVQVYVKELGLCHTLLRSGLVEHLAGLREMRHENVNTFTGCCVTLDSFSLVFHYCHRGSLQDVINNKSIKLDWDIKVSLMIDFVRGMEYLHGTRMEEASAKEILERVMDEEKPHFRPQLLETDVPPTYRGILQRSWSDNPRLRPTFKELNEEIQRLTSEKKANIVEHMFKMMEHYSSRLEEEVKARAAELELEKRKKELLICRLLPPVVAGALKAGVAVAPETYDEVSLYISDIVGFTTISAMSTPLQVVHLLNDLYTLFDKTIAHYDVYKVETIGDAYMVTLGLPVRNGRRHAAEVATMALHLLSACGTFTIRHLPQVPLRLRIGLHSEPCAAGVVVLTMPRYCLFGDTVNRALKLESSGAAFRIHISEETKEILDKIGG